MKNSASYNEFLEQACFARHTPVRIECILTRPDAKLPSRSRVTDAGYDLYSIEDVVVEPHKVINIHTGIKLSTPPGYFYTIEGRSSMWQKGVMPFSAVVDATYTGEVMIALLNLTDNNIEIKKYDRVAQIILQKIYGCDIIIVDDFGPEYNQRGTAGFGSSGR
jgi:dUTP pyrophosphatase